MKNVVYSLIFLMVFLSNCTKKNDIKFENKNEIKIIEEETIEPGISDSKEYMYRYTVMRVNSPEGLNVRNAPNINAEKINLLPNLTDVLIIDEDVMVKIDGIDGKWVQILLPIKGWVFSGYLAEKQHEDLPMEKILIGAWRIIDQDEDYNENSMFFMVYDFGEDGRFVYGQYATGFGFFGTWKIIDDESIELYGTWSAETSTEEDWNFETQYLNNIKCIDDDIVIFNRQGERFAIMKKGPWY
jgi:hypothetical protein